MNTAKKEATTIIFESSYTGHRSMYIAHLMTYINSHQDLHNKFLFILHNGMYDLLPALRLSENYDCEFIEINKKYNNHTLQSFLHWETVSKILDTRSNINAICFTEIDTYFVLIASKEFKRYKLKIRGILLQPYLHFKEINGGILFYIKNVLKNYIMLKYALFRNSQIEKLFILNDKTAVSILNNKLKKKFYSLPDPIENHTFTSEPALSIKILRKYKIDKTKKNLLVFGSIDTRKNLISIIDALRLLPSNIKQNIHLVISGKLGIDAREKYIEHIEKYKDEISIAYNDDFVKGEEREILFQNCDLVMMPYINFYSASSVVGHAICYSKNIIAPNRGLLGKIVSNNRIGLTVDPYNLHEIKDAVTQLLYNNSNFNYNGKSLMEEYSPSVFSKSLLD